MTERTYLVTIDARYRATLRVTASSKGEAGRIAIEEGEAGGIVVNPPECLAAHIQEVREVREAGQCRAID